MKAKLKDHAAPTHRRRSLAVLALAALLTLALAAIAVAEKPTTVRAGNLILTINGGVKPKALSKKTYQPIALNVQGKIRTADGTHPPALKEAIVDTDKAGTIDARGVPVCKTGQLEATTTDTARKTCKKAIVGTGTTDVEVQFPEQAPIQIKSQLTAFNGPGGGKGKATILIHAYLSSPVTAAIVTTVKVSKKRSGPYGTRSVASVPRIAGGAGSVTAFSLTFAKKLFKFKKSKHAYLLAKCDDGSFVARAEAVFTNGDKIGPGKVVRACKPKG